MKQPDSKEHEAAASMASLFLKLPKTHHSLSPSSNLLSPSSSCRPFSSTPWYTPPPRPRIDDVHILSTISEAINNSQTRPLHSSLRTILPSLSARHIINLINFNPHSLSPSSLLSFFNWLASRPPFRHTIQSYCAMAHLLCAHRMLPEAQSLLRFVVSRKGKDSAPSLFASILQTRGTHQSNLVFDALIIAYADSGLVEDAIQCFRLVRKNDSRIQLRACGNLLDKMMKLNSAESAWGFYLEILDCGYPPKPFNFNVLMHRFCKEGNIRNAQLVFDEMRRRSLRPTVVSFNTLINGYCKSGNLKEGFRLKSVMENEKTFPDVFTFSALINGLCKESRLDEANLLFDEMCKRGLVPNDVTFTTLIDGQCKDGKVDLAMKNFQLMLSRGIKPDLVTYNALINGLCRVGYLKEARKLLDEMSASGLKPDKITFTTLIDGCCKDGDLNLALEIKQKMIEEGNKLDDVAFTVLISGLCREGLVHDAEKMLREMLNSGLKPDDATYTMVIDGFCKKGDVKMGFKLLNEMRRNGHSPGVVTYNVLMNGLCKQGQMKNAKMLLDAMLNLGVVPDDITFNILLDGHCKHGSSDDFELFKSEKGLVTDYASYTALLNEANKASKDRKKR
ncbi:putative pentatricopeptide repeat-containing protein [Senna tora]|uniref:Putative pentatricopeptide repeat-containing protein n=1 Tax=Senna tora TaxID=362788 RepID=A0A834WR96_9FABA|nr:putative pentatricopeptide repeat-containing protein [Senna tora]